MWLGLICLISLGLVLACTDSNCDYCDFSSGIEQCLTCSAPLFPSGTFCEPCSSSVLSCQVTDSGFWDCECPTTGQRTLFETNPGDYSHCSFPEICQICVPGFYYSELDQCLPCDSQCKTCHDARFCTSCPDTLVPVGNNCCEPTCSLCNFESCIICNEGFELVSGTCFPASQKKCAEGCSDCDDNLKCLTCESGYYLDEESCLLCDSRERPGCPSILFECSTGCKECKSIDQCVRCIQGYYYHKGYCRECSPGCKFCTEYGKCRECLDGSKPKDGFCCDSTCDSCNEKKCWMCVDGLYLSDYKCQSCPENCLSCKKGVCQSKPCPNDCIKCNDEGKCIRCKTGFYESQGLCIPCHPFCSTCDTPRRCNTCPLSRFLDGENCCERNCQICDFTKCYKCNPPFELKDNHNCVLPGCPSFCQDCTNGICNNCELGYFIKSDGTCGLCNSNCYTCSSEDTCDSCSGSNQLINDACCEANCVSCNLKKCLECSEGLLLNDGKCYACPTKCEFCQKGKCVSKNNCDDGCVLCTKDECVSCSPGYFLKDSKECRKCSDRCSSCLSKDVCSNCLSPYILKGDSCCPMTCSECNSDKCSNCIDGYLLDDGKCVTCPSKCAYCHQGKCVLAVECSKNCKSCSSPEVCTKCISGYMVAKDGKCKEV